MSTAAAPSLDSGVAAAPAGPAAVAAPAKKQKVDAKGGAAVVTAAAKTTKPAAGKAAAPAKAKPAGAAAKKAVPLVAAVDNSKKRKADEGEQKEEEIEEAAPAAKGRAAPVSAKRKDGSKPGAPRILEKLKAMQPPRKINVPMIQLPSGECCLTPETWSWDFIGLKKVSFDKVTKTKHSRAYWILPDGREAEPLLYFRGFHSYFGFGWSNEIPGYEKSTPAIGITVDLEPGSAWEKRLEEGDKWLLTRIIELNEFLFDTKKSPEIIEEEYYIHRMLKRGKISEKSGEQMRNAFRQKVPHREEHHPDDVKAKIDRKKCRVLSRHINIKITDDLKQKIAFESLHQKESTFEGVSKFKGLAYSPSTKVSAQFELQTGRFKLAKPRDECFDLPELPTGSESATMTDEDGTTTTTAGETEDGGEAATDSAMADGEGTAGEEGEGAAADGEAVEEGGEEQAEAGVEEEGAGELAEEGNGQADGESEAVAEDGAEGVADESVAVIASA